MGAVSVTTPDGITYHITLPADIVGAAGSWTQSGIGAQVWAPHTGNFQYVYDTDKIIEFLEWGFGGNGPPVIRFKETQGNPVTATLFWALMDRSLWKRQRKFCTFGFRPKDFIPWGLSRKRRPLTT